MGVLKRAWDASGWIIGGYTVWKQLQSLSSAKDDLYNELSPSQQAQYDSIFGKPSASKGIQSPVVPQVVVHPNTQIDVPTQLTRVQAGV